MWSFLTLSLHQYFLSMNTIHFYWIFSNIILYLFYKGHVYVFKFTCPYGFMQHEVISSNLQHTGLKSD